MGSSHLDLRLAVRTLFREPLFAAAMITAVALGTGTSSAIFSIVNAVVLEPLPYPNPDRIVTVWETDPQQNGAPSRVSPPDFLDWKQESRSFGHLAAMSDGTFVLTGAGEPTRVSGAKVSEDFFAVLGLGPLSGRLFSVDEHRSESGVAILGYSLWQQRFGGAPGALGATLELDSERYVVIGVMPPFLDVPRDAQIWLPLSHGPDDLARGGRYLYVIGRLRDGQSLRQAGIEMDEIARRLETAHPETNGGWGVSLVPLHEEIVGEVRPAFLMLLGAVGFVVLIVCANLATMLLARNAARSRELGIRLALGAGRLRLARQLITESAVPTLLGGALGLLLATWGSSLLVALSPVRLPRLDQVSIDATVVVFNFSVALLTGLLAGLLPALRRPASALVVASSERGQTAGRGTSRIQSLILVTQIAVTLVLLVGAGLMNRSLAHLLEVDAGFRADHRLSLRIALPAERYPEAHQRAAFFGQLLERIEEIPEVTAAGAVTNLPLSSTNMLFAFVIEDRPPEASETPPRANYRAVSPGYFRAMGIPILEGRDVSRHDDADAPPVVVVNRAMARRFWPGEEVVGKRLVTAYDRSFAREIVGVVGDVRHFGLGREPEPEMYVPFRQNPWSFMTVVVHSAADVKSLLPRIRAELAAIDPSQPIDRIQALPTALEEAVSRPRFLARTLGLFGLLAAAIAAVGIYGLTAYWARLRHREMGVRLALGASLPQVFALHMGRTAALALMGIATGTLAALGLSRVLSGLLYGVTASDPFTYLRVASLLLVVAAAAGYWPARQATRVDPAVTLRHD